MGKKIIISEEEIKSLPVTTNRLTVEVDKEKFFAKYSIVSYLSFDKELKKNLAYEQLADCPFISVCGIKSKWPDSQYSFTKFFILVQKSEQATILESLKKYDTVRSRIDDLSSYTPQQQQRIFASLAINSLGEKKSGKRLYNNGFLLLCDDKNFLISERKKELVCLKIEVNEYLNLTATTTSFSNPYNEKTLYEYGNCVFQVSKSIDGFLWSGYSVKPVVLKKMKKTEIKLDELFIPKKRFSDNKNVVPYWPYNQEDYAHGKLFALTQIVESVNKKFDGLLSFDFTDFQVEYYDEYKTDKDTLKYIKDYFLNKSIFIDNPFGEKAKKLISEIQKVLKDIVPELQISQKQSVDDLILKLCEPIGDTKSAVHYSQSMNRLNYCQTAIQHKQFYDDEKKDSFSKSEARRILIDLLVKNCLKHHSILPFLGDLARDWKCVRYKINHGNVIGAAMSIDNENKIKINDFGFPNQDLWSIENFAEKCLLFKNYEKINGTKDYMALKKGNNVYLIIDTDEIPILDAKLIDKGYYEVVNNDEKISMFKRKSEAHKYLRGYMGFHLWKTDGISGEPNGSYSYISGFNSDNMKIMNSTKMDKMPRVRRIFVLHTETPNEVASDIMEIAKMLKFGFGRWNELMTYPFPFKFLLEFLDDMTETTYKKHWGEISSYTPLS